jgi:hypothetical protein
VRMLTTSKAIGKDLVEDSVLNPVRRLNLHGGYSICKTSQP